MDILSPPLNAWGDDSSSDSDADIHRQAGQSSRDDPQGLEEDNEPVDQRPSCGSTAFLWDDEATASVLKKYGIRSGFRSGGGSNRSRSPSTERGTSRRSNDRLSSRSRNGTKSHISSKEQPSSNQPKPRRRRKKEAPTFDEKALPPSMGTYLSQFKQKHTRELQSLRREYSDLAKSHERSERLMLEKAAELKRVAGKLKKQERELERLREVNDRLLLENRTLGRSSSDARQYADKLEKKLLNPQFNAEGMLKLKAGLKAWKHRAKDLEMVVSAQQGELSKAGTEIAVLARALEIRAENLGGQEYGGLLYELSSEKEKAVQLGTDLKKQKEEMDKWGDAREELAESQSKVQELEKELKKRERAMSDNAVLTDTTEKLTAERIELEQQIVDLEVSNENFSKKNHDSQEEIMRLQVQIQNTLLELSAVNKEKLALQIALKTKEEECDQLKSNAEQRQSEFQGQRKIYEDALSKEANESEKLKESTQAKINDLQKALKEQKEQADSKIAGYEQQLQNAQKKMEEAYQALKKAHEDRMPSHSSEQELRIDLAKAQASLAESQAEVGKQADQIKLLALQAAKLDDAHAEITRLQDLLSKSNASGRRPETNESGRLQDTLDDAAASGLRYRSEDVSTITEPQVLEPDTERSPEDQSKASIRSSQGSKGQTSKGSLHGSEKDAVDFDGTPILEVDPEQRLSELLGPVSTSPLDGDENEAWVLEQPKHHMPENESMKETPKKANSQHHSSNTSTPIPTEDGNDSMPSVREENSQDSLGGNGPSVLSHPSHFCMSLQRFDDDKAQTSKADINKSLDFGSDKNSDEEVLTVEQDETNDTNAFQSGSIESFSEQYTALSQRTGGSDDLSQSIQGDGKYDYLYSAQFDSEDSEDNESGLGHEIFNYDNNKKVQDDDYQNTVISDASNDSIEENESIKDHKSSAMQNYLELQKQKQRFSLDDIANLNVDAL